MPENSLAATTYYSSSVAVGATWAIIGEYVSPVFTPMSNIQSMTYMISSSAWPNIYTLERQYSSHAVSVGKF